MITDRLILALLKLHAGDNHVCILSEGQFTDFDIYLAPNGTVILEVHDVGNYRDRIERGEMVPPTESPELWTANDWLP